MYELMVCLHSWNVLKKDYGERHSPLNLLMNQWNSKKTDEQMEK